MRTFLLALCPLAASAVNILSSNDDGWAEINIRTFYDALTASGQSVLISAPAENESGTGSSDAPATTVGSSGCEFKSCPAGSPPEGNNASMPSFNYVNSYPVTSVKYGLNNLSTEFFGGPPDLVVAGPNVGDNLGLVTLFSGTVGAATYAASSAGIPAIAFSGSTGSQTAWNVTPVPDYSTIYADLATTVTNTLVDSGTPYLPSGVYLNVNFPNAGSGTNCTSVSDVRFVLSRINDAILTGPDVETCGTDRLPTETTVVRTAGCYASISVGNAQTKEDSTEANQAVVLNKLGSILSCLP